MPDTPANQEAYPQSRSQKADVGFPRTRIIVIFSLSEGTVLELFRELRDQLEPDDVLVAGRQLCTHADIAWCQQKGVHVVIRLLQTHHADFRRGTRLGREDHIVTWIKPARPLIIDAETYAQQPATMQLREIRIRVDRPGFRTQVLVIVTTLLDADIYASEALAELYRARWHAELDLRSLKDTMGMDILRAKSPESVRKEIWMHMLSHNLIREYMAQAAEGHGVLPREISFKQGWVKYLEFDAVLRPALVTINDVLAKMFAVMATHPVGAARTAMNPGP